MIKVKILHGKQRFCIKTISKRDAARLIELGEVEAVEEVEVGCAGETQEGLPCKLPPKGDTDLCWRHTPKEE